MVDCAASCLSRWFLWIDSKLTQCLNDDGSEWDNEERPPSIEVDLAWFAAPIPSLWVLLERPISSLYVSSYRRWWRPSRALFDWQFKNVFKTWYFSLLSVENLIKSFEKLDCVLMESFFFYWSLPGWFNYFFSLLCAFLYSPLTFFYQRVM